MDDQCPVCSKEIEDLNHALFTCSLLEEAWSGSIPNFEMCMHFSELMDLIKRLQLIEAIEVLEKIIMVAWSLWKRRNKKVFENELSHFGEDTDRPCPC